jgi:hypothetical protein
LQGNPFGDRVIHVDLNPLRSYYPTVWLDAFVRANRYIDFQWGMKRMRKFTAESQPESFGTAKRYSRQLDITDEHLLSKSVPKRR